VIDAFASQPHYVAHLAPIWWELPEEQRGCFYLAGAAVEPDPRQELALPLKAYGTPPRSDRLTLVAGYIDEQVLDRPVVYVEHGAGQTYRGDPAAASDPSYHGSPGHDRVRLFVSPNEQVASRWRERYADTPAVAAGCPKLDRWHVEASRRGRQVAARNRRLNGHRTVAFSFHHHSQTCPETRSAWPEYAPHMALVVAELKAMGWSVLGHWHPRLGPRMAGQWARVGAEPVDCLDEVFARADVFAADNTSALPEAASLGMRLVFMNSSGYRRDVEHGGRFWEWPQGQEMVDCADELPDAIERADLDFPEQALARARMVASVYAHTDGLAAHRAAASILSLQQLAA
jgi:hypothetical protein